MTWGSGTMIFMEPDPSKRYGTSRIRQPRPYSPLIKHQPVDGYTANPL